MHRLWNNAVDHYPKLLAALFLSAAIYFFVTAPPKDNFSIANCLSFISCLTVGGLLGFGAIGPDSVAMRRRRAARRAEPIRNAVVVHDVPERIFYYCPTLAWKRVVMLVAMSLLGLGIFCMGALAAICWKNPGEWGVRLTLLLMNSVSACIAIYFPWRQGSMYVRIDSRGIESRGYFRTVTMPWEDVVALVAKKIIVPFFYCTAATMLDAGDEFRVYSQTDVLRFVPRLPAAEDLRRIISAETGMVWNT
jgi:hypothetical protein